jgi:hypothetical protein
MSFLSILKVVGHDVKVGTDVVLNSASVAIPAIVTFDPALAPITPVISLIVTSIQRAEALFTQAPGAPSTGATKKQFVLDELSNALPLLQAGLGAAGKTIDTTAIMSAASSFIDVIVSVLNAVASFASAGSTTTAPAKV